MQTTLNIEELAVSLDRQARGARDRIARNNRRMLATFSDGAQHRRWLHLLLKEMASVIDATVPCDEVRGARRLYWWPGYDSILLDGARVTFEVDRENRRILADYGYPSGLSSDGSERIMQTGALFPSAERQKTDRATLYFDASLAGTDHPRNPPTTFSVGGMHNWLAIGPTVGGDPLLGIEVRTQPGGSASHRAFPVITLDASRPLLWGDELASQINAICGDTAESFWPLPVRRSGEAYAEYRERLECEHNSTRHRSIRQRLYSLWLIGCFVADPAAVLLDRAGNTWLERLIADLEVADPERAGRVKGLRELERNVASGGGSPVDHTCFTTWSAVTIPYAIADTRSSESGDEPDDLGSGMLLSNFDVPSAYYLFARQWIASYYLSLRQQESAVMRAEREAHRAALNAERELRKQLSHAVGTELTYVSFLATVAAELIGESLLGLDPTRFKAAVQQVRDGNLLDIPAFAARHGVPTALERRLIDSVASVDAGSDLLDRDVAIVTTALAAVPAGEARSVLVALTNEVTRVTHENRALVRVDEPSVIAQIDRGSHQSGDPYAERLGDLFGRAATVALTVYFRKVAPPDGELPEAVCQASAAALFGANGDSQIQRAMKARECASAWRSFIDRSYRHTGRRPGYESVLRWLEDELPKYSALRIESPPIDDLTRLAAGCGEYVPLIIEAWLTEALLNALKHSRPRNDTNAAVIRVGWRRDDALLEIANTTTAECAAHVEAGVHADAKGSSAAIKGHQGIAFLAYAARHLFKCSSLKTTFNPATSTVRLYIKEVPCDDGVS